MVTVLEHYPCPPRLEDEALLIETSGEMPEVALAESLLHLGPVSPQEESCLRGAVARGYLRIIARDLAPANLGASHFRGLERALANYLRLQGFLAKVQGGLDPATRAGLAGKLEGYLGAERESILAGRLYATCRAEDVSRLIRALSLDPEPWSGLLDRLRAMPVPDFLGLRALKRLEGVRGRLRRRERAGQVYVEVADAQGRVLAGAALPLAGPDGAPSPENQTRADMVCRLLEAVAGRTTSGDDGAA